jgi:hypothetical protein
MANSFKMVSVDIGTSYATAYTAPGSTESVVIGLQVGNVHASVAAWVSVKVVQSGGGTDSVIVSEINIPINDSFAPLDGKLVLEAGDHIQLRAQAASSLEATISVLEIS